KDDRNPASGRRPKKPEGQAVSGQRRKETTALAKTIMRSFTHKVIGRRAKGGQMRRHMLFPIVCLIVLAGNVPAQESQLGAEFRREGESLKKNCANFSLKSIL